MLQNENVIMEPFLVYVTEILQTIFYLYLSLFSIYIYLLVYNTKLIYCLFNIHKNVF